MRKIKHVEARVEIAIRDGSDAITRVTGPEGDEWRSQFYPLVRTEADVLDMWAASAVLNGIDDASRLDGWADLEPGEVTMTVLA